jgi:hypothetical protein
VEVASATALREKEAPPPSELVTPFTASAAPSASRARAINTSGAGSVASSRSSSGMTVASRSLGARPANLSSGASRAIFTARSGNPARASAEKSVEDTKATFWPTKTRRPMS